MRISKMKSMARQGARSSVTLAGPQVRLVCITRAPVRASIRVCYVRSKEFWLLRNRHEHVSRARLCTSSRLCQEPTSSSNHSLNALHFKTQILLPSQAGRQACERRLPFSGGHHALHLLNLHSFYMTPKPPISPISSFFSPPTTYPARHRIFTPPPFPLSTPCKRIVCVMPSLCLGARERPDWGCRWSV